MTSPAFSSGVSPPPVHERLLATAKALFAEHGYESTTTAAIARGAGTSESQLIKHFGGKEGLLDAVFESAWETLGERLREALAAAPHARARLAALGDVVLERFEGDPELAVLMLFEGRRIRKRSGGVVLTRGYLRLVEAIDGLLRESAQGGWLKPGVHPQAARAALIGAWEGLLRDRLLAAGGLPASYDREAMRAALAQVVGAFFVS